jgi:hypothetical protein
MRSVACEIICIQKMKVIGVQEILYNKFYSLLSSSNSVCFVDFAMLVKLCIIFMS